MATKVLFVEDDANWVKIFNMLVGNSTANLFNYVYVESVAAALDALKKDTYELILLDLMLPDSGPTNTIESFSSVAKFTPVVIITTLDDEKLILTAFQNQIQDYLIKDQYDLKTFLHVCRRSVQRLIGRRSSEVQQGIDEIINNLKSLDTKLEDAEKAFV